MKCGLLICASLIAIAVAAVIFVANLDWPRQPVFVREWRAIPAVKVAVQEYLSGLQLSDWGSFVFVPDADGGLQVSGSVEGSSVQFDPQRYPFTAHVNFNPISKTLIVTGISVDHSDKAIVRHLDPAVVQRYAVISLILAVLLFALVGWLWALIDCLRREFENGTDKIVWLLVLLFLFVFGAILYFMLATNNKVATKANISSEGS